MNMNSMQYDVNDVHRKEMERQAAKHRMANEVKQSSNVTRQVVERVVQMVVNMRMPKQREAIPAFDPKATANG